MKKIIEYSSTRFYITQKIYEELIINPDSKLKINTSPIKGKHPEGLYLIPNKIARIFIESKQESFNWSTHKNFKQDSVPLELKIYFKER
ncbi:hypothetical protein [Tenacibaculum finnmarkense]|uniref:hypothetical protein n=1 Tax=Tenacibaculum finnmarkense TaxID=2781243 RepID=UPI001E305CA4|nr:hypothetical protein [Tenacibaculum finnmarkense]MCD8403552.1 hypothetical protein [Tenacibaculum finnmarkense genomovar finnmarkense]MCD8413195.1 hypothetical protein [Tenacibaculum finnmarkense genomovar ulcerans]MCG8207178.1 hypothetical protein [Tenacibaculum finnmarkense genomovar finnmarkense]MCG8723245.1 hypothetical protein [Tenacibaculum finnmarkense]MCG8741615.1 hypothetical protein [Tenacibaculum finnmarkense]